MQPIQSIQIACLSLGILSLLATAVSANDHNNLDANRPLSFDDAESIAYREHSIELGAALVSPRARGIGGEFEVEYLYGFARNSHLILGIDSSVGDRVNSEKTRFDPGNVSIGVFHNFNREYDNTPAFAVRADAYFPTGLDARGVDVRLRGIASKTLGQYSRLHLNLDLLVNTQPQDEEKSVIPGVILGYSRPLGYPRKFDRTFLAEVGVRASEEKNSSAIVSAGIGLRQQVGYQNILDVGLKGDIGLGDSRESQVKLVMGYSFGF